MSSNQGTLTFAVSQLSGQRTHHLIFRSRHPISPSLWNIMKVLAAHRAKGCPFQRLHN